MDRAQLIALSAKMQQGRVPVYHTSISEQQRRFLKDVPVKGPMSICRITVPVGDGDGVNDVVEEAIQTLGQGSEEYSMPLIEEVKAEWVGHRSGVEKDTPEPKMVDMERYKMVVQDVTSDVVMLYAHGGAGYVGSAAGSRPMVSKLATLTGGLVLSVDYSLAPQHIFPTQLIEVLIAYLSLLYPPPGSPHQAVLPENIVFIGDSFGGGLMLALIQIILSFNSATRTPSSVKRRTLRFHGQDVPLPLPARVALISVYCYTSDNFPSWTANAATDSFPDLPQPFFTYPALPPCDAWPIPSSAAESSSSQSAPRGDLYCMTSLLSHPLVCPSTARSWKGCPPMYLANGEERCVDGPRIVARQALEDGVTICWEEYEGMHHVWPIYFPGWWQSELLFKRWGSFIKGGSEKSESMGALVGLDKTEREVDLKNMTEITPEEAKVLVDGVKASRDQWVASLKMAKTKL